MMYTVQVVWVLPSVQRCSHTVFTVVWQIFTCEIQEFCLRVKDFPAQILQQTQINHVKYAALTKGAVTFTIQRIFADKIQSFQ